MSWVCEEKLAAVAMGCVGLATLDPDKVVGGAVAGAGLLKLWGAAREQDGVASAALLARVRKRVGKGFADWAAGHPGAEADIRAADKAMAQHLADCVPPVAELAKTTYDEEDFPAYAARLIVDRLAERNPIFSETSDIRVPAAREFALAVVTGALTEAKSVEPFMVRLTQEVVLLIPQHLQRIERTVEAGFAKVDADNARQTELIAYLVEREQAREKAAGQMRIDEDRILTMARRIVDRVDDSAEAAGILERHIDIYLGMLAERERGSNLGDAADAAFERVLALIEAQDYAGALSQGEAEYRRLEEEEREQADRMAARKLRMVATNIRAPRRWLDR
jgi:hypothetical protein